MLVLMLTNKNTLKEWLIILYGDDIVTEAICSCCSQGLKKEPKTSQFNFIGLQLPDTSDEFC